MRVRITDSEHEQNQRICKPMRRGWTDGEVGGPDQLFLTRLYLDTA